MATGNYSWTLSVAPSKHVKKNKLLVIDDLGFTEPLVNLEMKLLHLQNSYFMF